MKRQIINTLIISILLIQSVNALRITIFPDTQGYPNFAPSNMTEMINSAENTSQALLFVGDIYDSRWMSSNFTDYVSSAFSNITLPYLISEGNHDREYDLIIYNYSLMFGNLTNYLLFPEEKIGIVSIKWGNYSHSEENKLLSDSNYSWIVLVHSYIDYIGELREDSFINDLNTSNVFLILCGHASGNNVFWINNYYSQVISHNDLFSPADEYEGMITLLDINLTSHQISSLSYSPISNKTFINLTYNYPYEYCENKNIEFFNETLNQTMNESIEVCNQINQSINYTLKLNNLNRDSSPAENVQSSKGSGKSGGGGSIKVLNLSLKNEVIIEDTTFNNEIINRSVEQNSSGDLKTNIKSTNWFGIIFGSGLFMCIIIIGIIKLTKKKNG